MTKLRTRVEFYTVYPCTFTNATVLDTNSSLMDMPLALSPSSLAEAISTNLMPAHSVGVFGYGDLDIYRFACPRLLTSGVLSTNHISTETRIELYDPQLSSPRTHPAIKQLRQKSCLTNETGTRD